MTADLPEIKWLFPYKPKSHWIASNPTVDFAIPFGVLTEEDLDLIGLSPTCLPWIFVKYIYLDGSSQVQHRIANYFIEEFEIENSDVE